MSKKNKSEVKLDKVAEIDGLYRLLPWLREWFPRKTIESVKIKHVSCDLMDVQLMTIQRGLFGDFYEPRAVVRFFTANGSCIGSSGMNIPGTPRKMYWVTGPTVIMPDKARTGQTIGEALLMADPKMNMTKFIVGCHEETLFISSAGFKTVSEILDEERQNATFEVGDALNLR